MELIAFFPLILLFLLFPFILQTRYKDDNETEYDYIEHKIKITKLQLLEEQLVTQQLTNKGLKSANNKRNTKS